MLVAMSEAKQRLSNDDAYGQEHLAAVPHRVRPCQALTSGCTDGFTKHPTGIFSVSSLEAAVSQS
jgi:hypothetical protein